MASEAFSNSRVWLITGSSSGLGRALVEELLAANERVVATLRKPQVLASLSEMYPPSQLLLLPLDVANRTQITETFEAIRQHFGRLDVVINNAGYGIVGEVENTPEEEARKMVEVLFWGPAHIMQEAIVFLRDVNPPGHGGRILNVSSVGGYVANATVSFYNAGKFALEGFTEAFTKEMLPEWNIKGTIIEPGQFRTEWNGNSIVTIPTHPKYDTPTSPSNAMRTSLRSKFFGNPMKAAKAMIEVASLSDPPLRVQLGIDSLMAVRSSARKTLQESEKYENLAIATHLDEVDRDALIERFRNV
ncbi:hypothetical protein AcV5_007922 [Taiwanofungus camphoratus]|nr:hypothetical protein AcV7_006076 [Antrodia cinnamomea]KAI0927369.1 hypothetical protein AcV5_007922 [Antrodia cinnamomea]